MKSQRKTTEKLGKKELMALNEHIIVPGFRDNLQKVVKNWGMG